MIPNYFVKENQWRISNIAVGSSAFRNQGSKGLVKEAIKYFQLVDLDEFIQKMDNKDLYFDFLNVHTFNLLNFFPINGKSWGAARKGLNLFFRDVIYNAFMFEWYKLPKDFEKLNKRIQYLELPLDSDVAKNIELNSADPTLKWETIKRLTPSTNERYQAEAYRIAKELKTARVHLDMRFWRQ